MEAQASTASARLVTLRVLTNHFLLYQGVEWEAQPLRLLLYLGVT